MEVDFCYKEFELQKEAALFNFKPKFKKGDICFKWKWNKNGTYSEDNPNTREPVIIHEVRINVRGNSIDSCYCVAGVNKLKWSWVTDDFLDFHKAATLEDLKDFY